MKRINFKKLILIVLFLFTINQVFAHSNVLYDISLDFDNELKNNVLKTAQDYLELNENQLQFDYDRELLVVQFKRTREYSVFVNPLDNSIFGLRDDSLRTNSKVENFDLNQRKEIAQKIFDNIPKNYKSELTYGEEKDIGNGMYRHTWYRYVNGIYISNNQLEVEIDASTGNIAFWRLSIFFYPKNNINTIPSITYNVAQEIAKIKFNAEPVDFEPILIVEGNKPIWVTKVKTLFPFFVAIDAYNGEILYSGALKTELPDNYNIGQNVEVVQNSIISKIYGEEQ